MSDEVSDIFDSAANVDDSDSLFQPFEISGTGNEKSDQTVASQISTVRSYSQTRSVGLHTYDRSKNDVMDSDNVGALVDADIQQFTQAAVNDIIEVALPSTTTAAAQNIAQLQQQSREPQALQTAYITAISNADSEVAAQEIANQFFKMKMQEIMSGEDDTLLETVADYGALFIPDTPWDVTDVTGKSMFNFIDDWNTILEGFRILPPEEQVLLAEPILKELLDKFDQNELKALSAAQDFVSPDAVSNIAVSGVIDTVDALTLGAGVAAKVLTKTVRTVGLVKAANKVDNADLAGKVNAEALAGDKAAQEVGGVDLHTAQMNTSAYKMEALDPAMTDGVAAETVKAVEARLTRVADDLESASFEGASLATAEERAAGKSAFIDEWSDRVRNIEQEMDIAISSEPKIVGDTPSGFLIEVTSPDGTALNVPMRFAKNDLGRWDALAASPSPLHLTSPSVYLKNVGNNLVNTATRLGFEEARNINAASKAYQTATKGLKTKQREKVDTVLMQGDLSGSVYTLKQLIHEGIATPNGVIRLSDKESEVYVSMRAMYDWLHMQKNLQVRRQKEFEKVGYAQFTPSGYSTNVEGVYAKEVGKDLSGVKRIYDFDSHKMVSAEDSQVALRLESDEYILTRFESAVRLDSASGSTEYVQTALMKRDNMGGLPPVVINYHNGYVPIIYEDVYHVIRSKQASVIDGVESKGGLWRTEGFFNNKADAETWIARQEKPENFTRTLDRQLPDEVRAENSILQFGSLFGSARSKRKLFQGLNEVEASRVNAFAAMERNLSHVAHASTMNEFRLGLITKFTKTAGKFLKGDGWMAPVAEGVNATTKASIERTRTWIQEQLRMPTEAERRFEGRMNSVANAIEGSWIGEATIPGANKKNLRKMFMDVGATDPYAAARSASFHALLGAFNTSQALVQAQNASIAFSMAPTRAPKLLAQYTALRMGMLNKKGGAVSKSIAESAGLSEKEFLKMVGDFDKTGLFQSVKSNADFAASLDGFRVDGGALKRATDNSLIFFREGEMFGRGYAWLLARDDWLKANKGKNIDALAVGEITDKSLAFTMNLNRANRADWQKGVLSLPTQYFQVTAKYIETLFGLNNSLTRTERAKMFVGQVALYGQAGVPIGGSWLASSMLDGIGVEYKELSQEEQSLARGGVWELGFELAFNARLQSDRFSVGSGIEELIRELNDEDSTLLTAMAGAFGTIPHRGWQALDKLSILTADVDEFNWTAGESLEALAVVGDIFSSFRNAHQAYAWYKLKEVRDRKGRLLFPIEEGDYTAIITKGLGFQPARVQDIYTADQYARVHADDVKNVVNQLSQAYMTYLADGMSAGTYQAAREALLQSLPTTEAREKAKKSFGKRIYETDSREDKARKKALRTYLDTGSFTGTVLGKDDVGLIETFGKEREE